MSDATDLVTTAGGTDVRAGLQAARALRRLAETLEAAQVENARRQGWSWTEIAAVLEVSKQAVHQRYARRLSPSDVQES
ncbi:MAG TPA: helix-turn-helix domain-containing protein [Kineosporiaceae bacterium]|nr:helix-turn-helix domain-containing protein [Kineosporiaceae bacterium]